MTISEIDTLATVVLDSSGNGQCSLEPPSGTKWALRLATMAVTSSSPQPQAQLYRGTPTGPMQLIDSTYTGSSASSAKVGGALYYPGQQLWAKWTGGAAGAVATLQIFGQQGNRSDPLQSSPLGEGFANPIVSQVIAGVPGAGPYTVINATPIPPELVTYYTAGSPATFVAPDTVLTVDLHYDGHGNYFYTAVVIDSSASPVTAVANGMVIAGTVTEIDRTTLNPTGAGSANLFFEHAKQTLHTGTGVDPAFVVLGASLGSDVNADRFQLLAGGSFLFGAGGTNVTPDTMSMVRTAAARLISDELVWNAGTAAAPSAETWHSPTLLNGWTNRGAGFPPVGYKRLIADRCVLLCGQILPGNLADNTILFNVPAGYRPTTKIAFAVGGAAGQPAAIMNVAINGDVTILNGAAVTALQFSHIYPLDR